MQANRGTLLRAPVSKLTPSPRPHRRKASSELSLAPNDSGVGAAGHTAFPVAAVLDKVDSSSTRSRGTSPVSHGRTEGGHQDRGLARGLAEATQWVAEDPAYDRPTLGDLVVCTDSLLDLSQKTISHLVGELRLSEPDGAAVGAPRQFL